MLARSSGESRCLAWARQAFRLVLSKHGSVVCFQTVLSLWGSQAAASKLLAEDGVFLG